MSWSLSQDEIREYLLSTSTDCVESMRRRAEETTLSVFGRGIYIRGLIEISNFCREDCYYCGIRNSRNDVGRYRLHEKEIVETAISSYDLGFRTVVLQGGEDPYFTDDVVLRIIDGIKEAHEDMRITLSLGVRNHESYRRLKEAGADRYLLRHETADIELFRKLHPSSQSFERRREALLDLKSLGYQVGSGFMVGPPGSFIEGYLKDLRFLKELDPHMIGIGPFMPAAGTVFEKEASGSADMTLRLISLLRILFPEALLPATTALNSLSREGRVKGIKHGCNVVMPNISPDTAKRNYIIYDNKVTGATEAGENLKLLEKELTTIGRHIEIAPGDSPAYDKAGEA